MGKTLKYVKDFEFPSDKGYSASSGQTMVKGYARGGSCGMAKGGNASAKMDRLKGVIGNERKEITRVEAKQRDAGQELSRVRSEMRYDKNEMKGMRKQYPTNRSEPMIAMKKGGHVSKKIMKKFDGGYIQDPASSGVPQGVSPLTQIANPQAQPALQNMIPPGNTSLSPTAMKRGGKVGAKLVKMANGGPMVGAPAAQNPAQDARRAQQQANYQQIAGQRNAQRQAAAGQRVALQNAQSPDMGASERNAANRLLQFQGGAPGQQHNPEFLKRVNAEMQRQQDMQTQGQLAQKQDMEKHQAAFQQFMQDQKMQGRPTAPEMMGPKSGQTAQRPAGLPAIRNAQAYQMGAQRGLGSAPMGRPEMTGPKNIMRPPSSVNTTTQSDMMGRNQRPAGGFNPANTQQGLQQFAARNNPQQAQGSGSGVLAGRFGPGNAPQPTRRDAIIPVQRPPTSMPPQQMGRPAMAKGGMLYSKKEVSAKNLLGEGKAPPLPHARGSVNMAKGGMTSKQQAKVGKVMGEFKAGDLHSGKNGPIVKSRKQAIAIGLSEARRAKK